jgi:biotin transport system substrate-specific component
MAVTWADKYRHWRYEAFRWRYDLSTARKLALALVFAGVIGLVAQIRIPFEPVPITGQTFAVLLAGAFLGRRWGGVSVASYVGLGAAGIPWFYGWSGGVGHLTGATMGYLIGFVLAALFVGYFCDTFINSRRFLPMLGLMLFASLILINVTGLLWLNTFMPGGFFSYSLWWAGMIMFIPGDVIKAIAAAAVVKGVAPKEAYNGELDKGKVWRVP